MAYPFCQDKWILYTFIIDDFQDKSISCLDNSIYPDNSVFSTREAVRTCKNKTQTYLQTFMLTPAEMPSPVELQGSGASCSAAGNSVTASDDSCCNNEQQSPDKSKQIAR